MNEQDLHFQRAALTEVATYRSARPSERVVVKRRVELAERLRHAAITNALDAGVPLRGAQILARHADLRTAEH